MFVTQICIPTQERGNEECSLRIYAFPSWSLGTRIGIAIEIEKSIAIPIAIAYFRAIDLFPHLFFCSYYVYPSRGY